MKQRRIYSLSLISGTLLFLVFYMFFLNQSKNTLEESFVIKEVLSSSLETNPVIPTFSFPTPPPTQTFAPSEIGGSLVCDSRVTDDPGFDILLISLDTGNAKKLTNGLDTIDNRNPKWSPDGRQIAFVSRRDGDANIYIMNSDGAIQERLTDHSGYDAQFNWSPDGSEIVFVSDRDGNSEIYKMNIHTKEVKRLTFEPASDGEPAWSSDGKRIVFVSSRAPGPTVFIMDANGENIKQITEASIGYARPVWCPDDKCLIVEKSGRNWYSKNELILLDLDTKEDRPLVINHPQISNETITWYATVSKIRKYIVFWALSDKMSLMYAFDMHKNELHSLGVQGCAGDLFP